MGKFSSHDFHLIVGKFTQDTRDTAPPPQISELYEIYNWLGKNCGKCIWSDSVVAKAAPFRSGDQRMESCQNDFRFISGFLGNFQREKG
jgi:ArsR family metal-binding transcriptional regulator